MLCPSQHLVWDQSLKGVWTEFPSWNFVIWEHIISSNLLFEIWLVLHDFGFWHGVTGSWFFFFKAIIFWGISRLHWSWNQPRSLLFIILFAILLYTFLAPEKLSHKFTSSCCLYSLKQCRCEGCRASSGRVVFTRDGCQYQQSPYLSVRR